MSPEDVSGRIDSPLGSLLATFFTAQTGDGKIRLSGAKDLASWDRFVTFVIQAHIANAPAVWQLSPGALEVFERFVNDSRDLTGGLSQMQKRLVELWPEQLLKIALLCALMDPGIDASATIHKAVMEQATTVLRMLGREQLHHHPMLQPAAVKLDPDIAGLLAKVRLHGPMSPRDLCRRFHKRRVDELERLLARASELGVLNIINGNVQILSGTMPVSVSAASPGDF